MNKHAILHITDSPYCFPISKNKIVLRLRTAKDDCKEVCVIYESKYVIGMKQKSAVMKKAYVGENFDYYEVTLELKDTRLAYVFTVDDGHEKFFFSEDGATKEYDFSYGYYNFFQYPFINEADIVTTVPWMKRAVFYQIFVERFAIGNKEKNMNYVNLKWGEIPKPKSFAGADLKGITNNLDYILETGCDSVYLTPVFESVSNHKYDISDYYKVAKDFGTNEDLKELVDEAHKRGMKVVLDAVFNHASSDIEQFADVCKRGKESPYFDWFVIYGNEINPEHTNYEMFASCKYMPKWNTNNPKVREYLIGIATHYIKEYDIDGWRLDVSDEISHDFWQEFRKEVKAVKEDAVIIGENWHDAYCNLRGDQFDSIMNYAFTKTCLDYFAKGTKNAKETAWKLNELLMRNKEPVNRMLLNLLDSHDTYRFFTEVGEKENVMKEAIALLFFFEGTPCVFYGTEIYTPGGYDPDCRRCMDWDKALNPNECKDMKKLIKDLSKARHEGYFEDGSYSITSVDDVLVVEKEYKGKMLSLYINHTDNVKTIEGVKLQPESFVILKNREVWIHE